MNCADHSVVCKNHGMIRTDHNMVCKIILYAPENSYALEQESPRLLPPEMLNSAHEPIR